MPDKIALSTSEKKGSIHGRGNRIYRWMRNDYSASIKHGYAVAEEIDNNFSVNRPATSTLTRFAGIVHDADRDDNDGYSIPSGDYGWILCKGSCDGFFKTTGAGAAAQGDSLKMVDGQFYLEQDNTAGTEPSYSKRAFALEAADEATAEKVSIFVDAM